MVRAFLLLGSNEGDLPEYLAKAIDQIGTLAGRILQYSALYETAAWGKTNQPSFLNQVIEIETSLTPIDLLTKIQSIESNLGRTRAEKWAARTLDIDILFYGNQEITEPSLVIPHPAIAQRRFTLVPLAELAPNFIHPILKKSITTLLNECPDKLDVIKT